MPLQYKKNHIDIQTYPNRYSYHSFAQLYMLKLMYPDHAKWNKEVYKPFIKLVNKYKPYILMKHLDFPYRWKSMLKY